MEAEGGFHVQGQSGLTVSQNNLFKLPHHALFPFCHCHAIHTEEDSEILGPREPQHGHCHIGKHHKYQGGCRNERWRCASPQDQRWQISSRSLWESWYGYHRLKRNQSFCPTANLDKPWTLVSEQTRSCPHHLCCSLRLLQSSGQGRLPVIPKAFLRQKSWREDEGPWRSLCSGGLKPLQRLINC